MKYNQNKSAIIKRENRDPQKDTPDVPLTNETSESELEKRLRESEERFHFLFEQASIGMAFATLEGKLFQVNQRYYEILGYTPEELLHHSYQDFTHPDDIPMNTRYLQDLLEGKTEVPPLEKRYVRKDGSIIWANSHLSLMCDSSGKPLYFMAIMEDITVRKRAEEERLLLLQREQTARAYAEATATKLTMLQSITDTTLAHLSLENLLSELLARITDILHTDAAAVLLPDEQEQYLTVRAALGLEQDVIDAIVVPMAPGQAGRAALRLEPLIIEDLSQVSGLSTLLQEKIRSLVAVPLVIEGRVIGFISVGTIHPRRFVQDDALLLQRVADRIALAIDHVRLYEAQKRARAEATARAQQLEAIFDSITDGIYVYDKTGRIVQSNAASHEILGFDERSDYFSRSSSERAMLASMRDEHEVPLSSDALPIDRILQGEVFKNANAMDVIVQVLDGRDVLLSVTGAPLHDNEGTIVGGVFVMRDVTERRLLEQRMRETASEAAHRASQLEATFEAMTDSITVYDKWGKIVFASGTTQEMFPLESQPDYYSLPLEERIYPFFPRDEHGELLAKEQWPVSRILRGEVLKGKNVMDVIVRLANGKDVQFTISGSPMFDADGAIIGGVTIAQDVTERRRLERRTHEALNGLLAMAESLVQIPEENGDIDTVGQRLAELTRRVLDCQRVGIQAVEAETEILRPVAVVGLSQEQERDWWKEQRQQEISLRDSDLPEVVARLRENNLCLFDMTEPPFNKAPNPYNIKVMLVAPMCVGKQLVGLLTLDYSGENHRYTESELVLASAVAKLAGLVIERQRLLRERAEAQGRELALREANSRMEEFLGIASHELRTPLTSIKANVQLSLRRLKAIKQVEGVSAEVVTKVGLAQDMLSRAESQIGVLNRLVGDLIDISRIRTGKLQLYLRKEPANVVQIVRETVEEQRKATPERTIILDVDANEALFVIADPDRIGQVITNFLSNALKYSEATRPVKVHVKKVQAAEGKESTVRVSVSDQGPGLPLKEQKRVWEGFYQAEGIKVLSGSGVGLGLGLHISQTIIARHNGQVGIESQGSGHGSTFWFTLPLVSTSGNG